MTTKPKLYVGCGLTQAPESFRNSVEEVKDRLADDFIVLKFIGLGESTNVKVYQHDMSCVEEADFFLAVCDFPSLGLGVEIERARQHRKPTLAVAHDDSSVTRLVLGMSEYEPTMSFTRYTNLGLEVPNLVTVHFLQTQ